MAVKSYTSVSYADGDSESDYPADRWPLSRFLRSRPSWYQMFLPPSWLSIVPVAYLAILLSLPRCPAVSLYCYFAALSSRCHATLLSTAPLSRCS